MKQSYFRCITLLVCLAIAVLLSSCGASGQKAGGPKKIRIGFAMDALKQERWQKDRDLFLKRAEELGAEVSLQTADGSDEAQMKQVESLLSQGIDVLVIVPHNAEVAGAMVDMAKKQNVPVISYDRLVKNSAPDLYVSFDNERVGELEAKLLLDRAPTGNYVLIGGAPTDNNSLLLRKGQENILQPAIDRGDIKIVANQWAKEWLAEDALNHVENALTQNNNNITAVVTSNDGTAGGAIQALAKQGLAGKVLVSGQDAELAALQRILAGTQTMTVYKPISKLAPAAVEAAIALAKGEKLNITRSVNNGRIDVPSILIEPIPIDKNNVDVVINDGFQKREDVYRNAPPKSP
ncbi:MAG: D-xylose ABC transporter substrate-binding protein [Acidobacteria bacterium]|nr:D-xylose ABC transporter substrate-binding protein [Acidobacteriota bacterium]